MSADLSPYIGLITSEHRDKTAFIDTLSLILQPMADNSAAALTIPGLYDVDAAVAQQLDTTGLWIGRNRALAVPLTDVYFTMDLDGLGMDEGTLLGPYDPLTGLVSLPDDTYRTLLQATIAANQWDGTIPGAYLIWSIVFGDRYYGLTFYGSGEIEFEGEGVIEFGNRSLTLIQDYGDMSMLVAVIGLPIDAVTLALFVGGYLSLKPAGVREIDYVGPSVPWAPLFGLDAETDTVSGLDGSGWAAPISII